MEYNVDNQSSLRKEKYNSTRTSKPVERNVENYFGAKKYRECKETQRKTRALLEQEEQGYTKQLTDLGKLSYFIEHFDMIRLEDQNLSPVGPFEDPRERTSFKYGHEMAKTLVANGFSENNYLKFLQDYELKYQINNTKNR